MHYCGKIGMNYACQWLDVDMHVYAKFEQNISSGLRVTCMSIFTN